MYSTSRGGDKGTQFVSSEKCLQPVCGNLKTEGTAGITHQSDYPSIFLLIIEATILSIIEDLLQTWKLEHAQSIEIRPGRLSEEIVDDFGAIPLASHPLLSRYFFQSGFGLGLVSVRVEQFHDSFAENVAFHLQSNWNRQ